MNARKLALASTAIVALSGVSATGALAATTTKTATAEIVDAAQITVTAPQFGSVSGTTGTITLAPGGTRTVTNFGDAGGSPSAGQITLSQSSGTVSLQVTLNNLSSTTASAQTLEATSLSLTATTANTHTASTGVGNTAVSFSTTSTTLGGNSATTWNVGAKVTHGSAPVASGSYEGNFKVTINNN